MKTKSVNLLRKKYNFNLSFTINLPAIVADIYSAQGYLLRMLEIYEESPRDAGKELMVRACKIY